MQLSEVLIGLGANLGDPVPQLRRALNGIEAIVSVEAVSSVFRTAPVGFVEQPDFYNLACRARSRLPPLELLRALLRVEQELGRSRSFRNAPRTIDIDLLAYGGLVIATPEMVLPHPRMHQRAFVLVPLAEVAPQWRHPVLDLTVVEMLGLPDAQGRVERWGTLPEPE